MLDEKRDVIELLNKLIKEYCKEHDIPEEYVRKELLRYIEQEETK